MFNWAGKSDFEGVAWVAWALFCQACFSHVRFFWSGLLARKEPLQPQLGFSHISNCLIVRLKSERYTLFLLPVGVASSFTWNSQLWAIWVFDFFQFSTCFLPTLFVTSSSMWNSYPPAISVEEIILLSTCFLPTVCTTSSLTRNSRHPAI